MNQKSSQKLYVAVGWLTGVLLVLTLTLWAVLHAPGLPYNVTELFQSDFLFLRIGFFSMFLIWLGLAPSCTGLAISRRPRLSFLIPLWALLIGQGSWFLLQLSVTRESRLEIIGSVVWNLPRSMERAIRFWSLQGIPTILLIISFTVFWSFFLFGRKTALRRLLETTLLGVPFIVLSAMVVFHWPSTDNIVELVRVEPTSWFGPALWVTLVGLLSVNSAWQATLPPVGAAVMVFRIAITVALVVPGWTLLYYALDPAVEKYGLVFPAIRFLLGPDRATELSWTVLFLRWGFVQLGIVCCLSLGGWIAGKICGGRDHLRL